MMDTLFVRHEPNQNGRTFVVGDIHGQYQQLQEALQAVSFDRQKDLLFAVGDLIDRGQESLACLSLIFEPWCHSIIGNHERLALEGLRNIGSPAWDLWISNGGNWIYSEDVREVSILLDEAFRYLPLAREIKAQDGRSLGLVHAEPPRDWRLLEAEPQRYLEQLTWARTRIKQRDTSEVGYIDAVAVGHTVVDSPVWLGNVCYLDTGAFTQDGRLTLIELHELLDANPLAQPAEEHVSQ